MEIRKIKAEDTWPVRHRVMWPNQPFDFVKVDEDHEGIHYGLFVDDELVSIVSLFLKDGKAQFRKFATEVQHQGKGYGTILLNYLLKEIEGHRVSSVWCNARTEKAAYYERFGLHKTNATYMKGGIEFVVMEKTINKPTSVN
ncbi:MULTISPECIES: GNAT family N-acetyltransferase [unclassified Imperialibacter]|uniref:GNAT family N-acetyltransferase n=1 Tax=unclassified Imperialibacter TaxID=2629706 RepID=UPI0012557023|nr:MULTISPECIES: GNAT family N-acetyltransferase [unclassified Imperialibacter]CAD5257372.1 GNAT family N-acetyltransferase [Imperialibacter sp. 75]CAD5260254.1 GNAT family N-acetyltransferase [Imperialibacter sp. 89]VVT25663.1 GNAT family N-acetyltransferase [Imperialibacter sp. EC-SDR9]